MLQPEIQHILRGSLLPTAPTDICIPPGPGSGASPAPSDSWTLAVTDAGERAAQPPSWLREPLYAA